MRILWIIAGAVVAVILIATMKMWPEIKRYLNMRRMIHVVWMTTGLGCDGDSVSLMTAIQHSIEDIVMGAILGLPKVYLHNAVLADETGEDFLKFWHQATAGKLEPSVPVLEGSVPNENIKKEDYWARPAPAHRGHALWRTASRIC